VLTKTGGNVSHERVRMDSISIKDAVQTIVNEWNMNLIGSAEEACVMFSLFEEYRPTGDTWARWKLTIEEQLFPEPITDEQVIGITAGLQEFFRPNYEICLNDREEYEHWKNTK
jgi:hypothetical protein